VDGEEAEYAWLPISCLKPFERGDAAKHAVRDGSLGGEDANLSACVQAAEHALNEILEHSKKVEARAGDEDEVDSAAESDSDGGACPSCFMTFVEAAVLVMACFRCNCGPLSVAFIKITFRQKRTAVILLDPRCRETI
jgi:hypothetical protein